MSIALGEADGISFTVPSSVPCFSTVTVYLSSLITSLRLLRTSSGNFVPPSSADDGNQVPSSESSLASSPQASDEKETTITSVANSLRSIRILPKNELAGCRDEKCSEASSRCDSEFRQVRLSISGTDDATQAQSRANKRPPISRPAALRGNS